MPGSPVLVVGLVRTENYIGLICGDLLRGLDPLPGYRHGVVNQTVVGRRICQVEVNERTRRCVVADHSLHDRREVIEPNMQFDALEKRRLDHDVEKTNCRANW
jgi:hypothetical protein